MAVDTIQFVDSIASSPTVRLDINDGTTWRTSRFEAPPPRLRRAMSSNAMRDGIFVSSSQYDSRVITLGLTLVHTSEDAKATEIQKLARELDRTDNFLRYQPTGATKPVFFRLFRSDMSQLEQFTGVPSALAKPTIELLAEPFALGLRETLGPFTVNNDPAAGSNGLFFDVTGVIGDVPAPVMMTINDPAVGAEPGGYFATTRTQFPTNQFQQCESMTLGTDTTNPGGGPDAAMSGTGTNNFVRTSFATASMVTRLTLNYPGTTAASGGRYRLLVVVRKSASTDVINVRRSGGVGTGPTVSVGSGTGRQLLDLGVLTLPAIEVGKSGTVNPPATGNTISISAERTSGAGTLDWDFAVWVPVDEQLLIATASATAQFLDSTQERFAGYTSGDPTAGTAVGLGSAVANVSGGFPWLAPNVTNRVVMVADSAITLARAVTIYYWPQYSLVRPSAS